MLMVSVRVRPHSAVQAYHLVPKLFGRGPHVCIGLGTVVVPGQGLAEGPSERGPEVPRLDAGHMFHQAQ